MIKINNDLRPSDLRKKVERLWEVSAAKILSIDLAENDGPSPVFTVRGKYVPRPWTDWTRGFAYGSALLQFDAFWDETFLKVGRERTARHMAPFITHHGSHDHGFTILSTFGNLWRLTRESRLNSGESEMNLYELALKCSGAIQAQRWTHISNGEGFIHSLNGPHSLLASTMRSLRSLALSHHLGHVLVGERDEKISLLRRLVEHAKTTARWAVFQGTGRDGYDRKGRVAQESIFNIADGAYRGPATVQGYSPFTTNMRSLAWVMLGFTEQIEFLSRVPDGELEPLGGRGRVETVMIEAARACCDFYIEQSPHDGIPYWDSGAPGLRYLENYLDRPAEPFNDFEPVDSSAASIGAQGLLRLGNFLTTRGQFTDGERYWQAGLTVLDSLFAEPYLSTDSNHQGLILHSIYHRPNGWDHIPEGRRVPCGEATIWGDYQAREVALYLQRVYEEKPYLTFFSA